jgi:hypothetical protein
VRTRKVAPIVDAEVVLAIEVPMENALGGRHSVEFAERRRQPGAQPSWSNPTNQLKLMREQHRNKFNELDEMRKAKIRPGRIFL